MFHEDLESRNKEPLKILLIEDDADFAHMLIKYLSRTRSGVFDIEYVDRLSEGTNSLAQKKFNLILLDLFLSDSQGLATLQRVHEQVPEIPIVVLTGLRDKEAAIKAIEHGAHDFLVKGEVDEVAIEKALYYAAERNRLLEHWKHSWHEQYYQATHDALTGLPNRALFEDHLIHDVFHAKRHSFGLAVLFIDVDHFKEINDSFGHSIGDQVLRETVNRLKACLRGGDTLARHGGDEFCAILYQIQEIKHVFSICNRMQVSLVEPVLIEDKRINTSLSVGISLFPLHAQTAHELVRMADTAMYEAKKAGGNQIVLYSASDVRPSTH